MKDQFIEKENNINGYKANFMKKKKKNALNIAYYDLMITLYEVTLILARMLVINIVADKI